MFKLDFLKPTLFSFGYYYCASARMIASQLTLIPLGYFEDLSPLGGGWGGADLAPPPLRSRQLMDRLTRKLAQS